MNYIVQLNAFQECILEYELGAKEIALWYALMGICNRTGWKEEFNVSMKRLALMSGMSESSVKRTRERLEELGIISFSTRSGCQSATYHMVDLTGMGMRNAEMPDQNLEDNQERIENNDLRDDSAQFAGHSEPQIEPQTERIHKTKTYNSLSVQTDIERIFEKFWEAYPLGASERNAREAYVKIVLEKGVSDLDLLDAAKNYAAHCRFRNVPDKYVKHAANWLKEEVYVDYLPGNWKENIVEYKKPSPTKKISSGGAFSCECREYDYEELERRLLAGGG